MTKAGSTEKVVREIRRHTRRRFSAEEKIRIVLDGLRGEEGIAAAPAPPAAASARKLWFSKVQRDVTELQEYLEGVGERVLDSWPVPLKGYRYRFQVVDSDDVNAFAVPTGYIFMTRGLLQSLESDNEVAAILAHEIAHVESRHSYRIWRNAQRASTIAGIVGLFAGGTDNNVDDIVAIMTSFTANLFMAGHGRDREREADLFASFYLTETDVGDRPLLNSFRKLKFARDAHDLEALVAGCDHLIIQTTPARPSGRSTAQAISPRGTNPLTGREGSLIVPEGRPMFSVPPCQQNRCMIRETLMDGEPVLNVDAQARRRTRRHDPRVGAARWRWFPAKPSRRKYVLTG